jgi:hypothetical protein
MQILQTLSLYGVSFVWRLIDFNLNSIQDLFYFILNRHKPELNTLGSILLWATEHQM